MDPVQHGCSSLQQDAVTVASRSFPDTPPNIQQGETMFRTSLTVLLFLLLARADAQIQGPLDSGRVVILSDRVGPVIDGAARDRFRLFAAVPGFLRATVLQQPDSSFVIWYVVSRENGIEKDSVVQCSSSLLRSLAEKIDNYEAISEGRYRIGQNPVSLRYASGGAVVPKAIAPSPALKSSTSVPGSPQGRLPLARGGRYPRYRSFPALDIGLGLRTFSPKLDGLSGVYGGTPLFEAFPMISALAEVAFTESIGIQVDGGGSVSNQGFEATAGLFYYFHPISDPDFRPFLGGGLAICSIRLQDNSITTEGGATGIFLETGLEYDCFNVYAAYRSFPVVTAVFSDSQGDQTRTVNASVDFKGMAFGFRVKLFQ